MAHIRTFSGDGDSLDKAIAKAEEAAQGFLTYLTADRILSVQAQTIAAPWKTEAGNDIVTAHVPCVSARDHGCFDGERRGRGNVVR